MAALFQYQFLLVSHLSISAPRNGTQPCALQHFVGLAMLPSYSKLVAHYPTDLGGGTLRLFRERIFSSDPVIFVGFALINGVKE